MAEGLLIRKFSLVSSFDLICCQRNLQPEIFATRNLLLLKNKTIGAYFQNSISYDITVGMNNVHYLLTHIYLHFN